MSKKNLKNAQSNKCTKSKTKLKKTVNTKTTNSIPDEVIKDLKQIATPPSRKGNAMGKILNSSVVGGASGFLWAILSEKAFVETPILWGLLGSTVAVSWPVLFTWAGIGAAGGGVAGLLGAVASAHKAKTRKEKKRKKLEGYIT